MPEPSIMDEKYYTPRQVAEKFEINIQTVRSWCREGKLRSLKVGQQIRIPESAIVERAQEMYGE